MHIFSYFQKSAHTDYSYANVPQSQRTEHVHSLHPYLGKYIPQIPRHFLKRHFNSGSIILDPFMGSGTTLVEANILNINSIGVDIAQFNCLLSLVKTQKYNFNVLNSEIDSILSATERYSKRETKRSLKLYPNKYLKHWLHPQSLHELLYYKSKIKHFQNQEILKIILTRSLRSARLTTHYDIARPRKPTTKPYYCLRHKKICTPPTSSIKFLRKYSNDSLIRLKQYNKIKTPAKVSILHADARKVALTVNSIDGIITSPPYLGKIDYHDQHRYAYEILGLKDNSTHEIGSTIFGNGNKAKSTYFNQMKQVFSNLYPALKHGAKLFIVVKDEDGIYQKIAEDIGLTIHSVDKRRVTQRSQRDGKEFYEKIYFMQK